jgi:very-short-patch-repair endonuclease
MRKFTTNQFIDRARAIHGNKYDYSLVEYVNAKTEVVIICPIHGPFMQKPYVHLNQKGGCNACGEQISSIKQRSNTLDFILKAQKIHGNLYDCSLVKYINNRTKIKIICPVHGVFHQTPSNHLIGRGCRHCANELKYVGVRERKLFQPWLKSIFKEVKFQYEVPGLTYVVDAFIPSLNLIVEFDEKYHKVKKYKSYDLKREEEIKFMSGGKFYRIDDMTFLDEKKKPRKGVDTLPWFVIMISPKH